MPLHVSLIHQGSFKRRPHLHFPRPSLKPKRDRIRPSKRMLLHCYLPLPLIRHFLSPNLLRFELIQRRRIQMFLILWSFLQPKGVGRLIALLALVLLLIVLIPSWMMEEGLRVLAVTTVAIYSRVVLLWRIHGNKPIKFNIASCSHLPTYQSLNPINNGYLKIYGSMVN